MTNRNSTPTTFGLLGELADICPACRAALFKRPQRKTRCRACGANILLKMRPQDRARVLVTEADALEIEQQWLIVHGLSGRPEHNVERKAELRRSLDVAMRQSNWGIYYGHLIELGQIHEREGDAKGALELLGGALFLGAAGASNPGFDLRMRDLAPGAVAALDIAWEALGSTMAELREIVVASAHAHRLISNAPLSPEAAWELIHRALERLR